jgi:hypothetical protein
VDVPRHLNFFTQGSLVEICRRLGLEIESVEFLGYSRQFHRDWAAKEARTRRAFSETPTSIGAAPRIRSAPSRWSMLLSTVAASAGRKYDSVRVTARRPA